MTTSVTKPQPPKEDGTACRDPEEYNNKRSTDQVATDVSRSAPDADKNILDEYEDQARRMSA